MMMINTKNRIFMCISVVTLFLPVKMVFAQDTPEAMKGKKVVIAYEKTAFKKGLAAEIGQLLKTDSINVTTMEHSDKAPLKIEAASSDAVFISASGVNSKIRPWVVTWLENNKQHSSKIILHVTQTKNWIVKTHVDAVTSASSKKDMKKLASEYAGMIKTRLSASVPQKTDTEESATETDTQKVD
ncbi:MAG: hypothetical protein JW915_09225 [Chitinispirillaceae bacterium]|nr:hypothetical protein [Chitinispirillaceae bacterium]